MRTQPVFLSGVANDTSDKTACLGGTIQPFGLLVQPLTFEPYFGRSHNYEWIGIDNGCFSEIGKKKFNLGDYLVWMRKYIDARGDSVLWVTAPDVVGDWEATLESSLPVLPLIRSLGGFAALVSQDGATPETTPWDSFDCLFVGGSTDWKLGEESRLMCHEAKKRGKWVHMGRVNSKKRLLAAGKFGCDSVDGTFLKFRGPTGVADILHWLRESYKAQSSEYESCGASAYFRGF